MCPTEGQCVCVRVCVKTVVVRLVSVMVKERLIMTSTEMAGLLCDLLH